MWSLQGPCLDVSLRWSCDGAFALLCVVSYSTNDLAGHPKYCP